MIKESMKDIGSDEELSGDDDDPDLLVSNLILNFQKFKSFQVLSIQNQYLLI